jgi:hypothetical protein
LARSAKERKGRGKERKKEREKKEGKKVRSVCLSLILALLCRLILNKSVRRHLSEIKKRVSSLILGVITMTMHHVRQSTSPCFVCGFISGLLSWLNAMIGRHITINNINYNYYNYNYYNNQPTIERGQEKVTSCCKRTAGSRNNRDNAIDLD